MRKKNLKIGREPFTGRVNVGGLYKYNKYGKEGSFNRRAKSALWLRYL